MSFPVAARTTGELITASVWNADVKDNLNTLRAGGIAIASQAALDFIYGSSASQLARLAAGGALTVPRINAAGNGWEFASIGLSAAYFSTIFESTARLNPIVFGSGVAPAVSSSGLFLDTSASAGASGILTDFSKQVPLESNFAIFGSLHFITKGGTIGDIYFGIAAATVQLAASVPSLATNKHFGFKVSWTTGNGTLSATQSDGVAEAATVLDSGIVAGDQLVLYAEVNAAQNAIDYSYWKNGGARSAVTTISSRYPTGNFDKQLEMSITSRNQANQSTLYGHGMGLRYGT